MFNANDSARRVYLAGPDCFLPDAQARYAGYCEQLAKAGFVGLVPSDGGLSQGALPGLPVAKTIFQENLKLIESSCAVIANLSAFRGVESDSGTAFEVGFAHAKGIAVFCWSTDRWWPGEVAASFVQNTEHTQSLVPYAQLLSRANRLAETDNPSAVAALPALLDKQNAIVENMGLPFNLMLGCAASALSDSFEHALQALIASQLPVA